MARTSSVCRVEIRLDLFCRRRSPGRSAGDALISWVRSFSRTAKTPGRPQEFGFLPKSLLNSRRVQLRSHFIRTHRRGALASMGPRSFDRGSDAVPTTGVRRPFQLQWGRDHLIAEVTDLSRRSNGLHHASMGPRSFDRGSKWSSTPSPLFNQLQWGRDHLIAEVSKRHE